METAFGFATTMMSRDRKERNRKKKREVDFNRVQQAWEYMGIDIPQLDFLNYVFRGAWIHYIKLKSFTRGAVLYQNMGLVFYQWIGLRENLNRKPMGFYHQIDRGFRFKFSHHPIL